MTEEEDVASGSLSENSHEDSEVGNNHGVQPDGITVDPLGKLIAEHQEWLESGGREGKLAELSEFDLQERDLSHIDLRGSDLSGAVLYKTNLSHSDMRGASLAGAKDLGGSNFQGTDLRLVDLHDSDLSSSVRLQADQFGGGDISGALLPGEIANAPVLQSNSKPSSSVQRLFPILLVACAYVWIQTLTTTDVQLVLNNSHALLPIIKAPMPIVGFYIIAPLVLLAMYVYGLDPLFRTPA